jgi:ABC-type nitrate/sulfonate/bicarbonate transport system permease component
MTSWVTGYARAMRPEGLHVKRIWPSLLLLVVVILIWQAVASIPSIDNLTLASPVETWHSLRVDHSLLFSEARWTVEEIVLGLLISVALGVGLAILMHLARPFRDAAYPLLLASQAIPIVVLAPLFILAFGYGIGPKLAIIALICFFPIVVVMLDGLRSVDADLLKLMESLGASRTTRLWKAELPSSLPYLFSGLRLAAVFAVIGAVFGEWAGADRGLGRLVLLANNQLQTPRVYAGIVLLTVMAIALFAFVSLVERVVLPWRRER